MTKITECDICERNVAEVSDRPILNGNIRAEKGILRSMMCRFVFKDEFGFRIDICSECKQEIGRRVRGDTDG